MNDDRPTNEDLQHRVELLNAALNAAEIGIWTLDPISQIVEWDERCRELYGVVANEIVSSYDAVIRCVHPEDRKLVMSATSHALSFDSGGRYELQFRTQGPDGRTRWIFSKGQAYFNDDKKAYRFTGTAQDISNIVHAQNNGLSYSQHSALALISANAGSFKIKVSTGEFEYSPMLKKIFTGSLEGVVERDDLIRSIHPDDVKIREAAYTLAEQTGMLHYEARIVRKGGSIHWITITGQYEFDSNGKPITLSGIAVDSTESKKAQQALADSEIRFRRLIEQAPIATGLFLGKEMKIAVANDLMISYWGKGRSVMGKSIRDALPELREQGFPALLDEVFTTGQAFHAKAARADIQVDGVMRTYYFDFTYQPVFDELGNVYGVMDMAVDVTDQVVAEQKVKETEMAFRSAIEVGKLEVWNIDPAKKIISYSDRFASWIGTPETQCDLDFYFDRIDMANREVVREAYLEAIRSGSSFDREFTIQSKATGRKRILHALGKAMFNENGQAVKLTGIIQDVTEQRNIQLALEHLVQAKTEELNSSNEELAASNEELAASNEELAELNTNLAQSNQQLEQYAYAASHDLQEPLRKIQTFTNRLSTASLPEHEQQEFYEKINKSAARMAMLIQELLKFSRLKTSEKEFKAVDLNLVAKNIVNDFELLISELSASVQIFELPVIEGVEAQLNQLFYNLFSNALKFVSEGKAPAIVVKSTPVSSDIIAKLAIRPIPEAQYYEISISDNGIGINPEYQEQIFEIFKRLHTKDKYPGSGIGLAISKRIIENHNGFLAVDSVEKQGATFRIFLPASQNRLRNV